MPFQIAVEKPHQQKLTRNGDKCRDVNDDLKTSLLLIPINSMENRTENRTREQNTKQENNTEQQSTDQNSTLQHMTVQDRGG